MSPCPQARGDPGDPAGMGISPRPRPVPSGPDHGACCQPRPQAAPRGHPSRVGTGEAGLAGPTPRTPRPRVAAGPGGGARSVGRSGHGRDRARGAERVPGEIGVRRGLRRTAGSRRGTPPGGGMEGDDVLPVAGGPISQFPMDVSLLRMLQLALCSPEAPFKAELHGEAGDKRSDKSCGNGVVARGTTAITHLIPCTRAAQQQGESLLNNGGVHPPRPERRPPRLPPPSPLSAGRRDNNLVQRLRKLSGKTYPSRVNCRAILVMKLMLFALPAI
ncbi:uncharacterized protein LOC141952260 isoform X2 [Strix uralensis]|uniref:uncharacterized protein LOC141952260 isoform X2 n=1 Tax=Strix uralensis TaxID=36305 RepID=UPI003DA7127A